MSRQRLYCRLTEENLVKSLRVSSCRCMLASIFAKTFGMHRHVATALFKGANHVDGWFGLRLGDVEAHCAVLGTLAHEAFRVHARPAIILAIARPAGRWRTRGARFFRFDMCEFMDERMSFLPMVAVRLRLRLGELWLFAVLRGGGGWPQGPSAAALRRKDCPE